MSHHRVTTIPVDHLVAEVVAFPLASAESLRSGVVRLARVLSPPKAGDFEREANACLWRQAERSLITSHPSFSIDELIAIRDRTWFTLDDEGRTEPVTLAEYLRHVARTFLKPHGSKAIPWFEPEKPIGDAAVRSRTSPASSREIWRWIGFALPEDLLLSALSPDGLIMTEVEALSPEWERWLEDKGFAEMHLHVGAGIDFSTVWANVMSRISNPTCRHNAFASPGAQLEEGRHIAPWLIRAAIARLILAAYLRSSHRGGTACDPLESFLFGEPNADKPTNKGASPTKLTDASRCGPRDSFLNDVAETIGLARALQIRAALDELAAGEIDTSPQSFVDLQAAYAVLVSIQPSPEEDLEQANAADDFLAAVHLHDPVAKWFPRTMATPEMRFTRCALQHLARDTEGPCIERPQAGRFEKLFWQVIRVRCLFYRHIVQRPMTPGLQWFVRTFGRLGPAKKGLPRKTILKSAARLSGLGSGLKSLEARTSPDDSFNEVIKALEENDQAFREAAEWPALSPPAAPGGIDPLAVDAGVPSVTLSPSQLADLPEFGMVLHLIRERSGGTENGLPSAHWFQSNAEPPMLQNWFKPDDVWEKTINVTGYRYAAFYQQCLRQVRSIARALLNFPLALSVLRGIDACTDELGVPTWMLVPLFRYLDDVSSAVSAWLAAECPQPTPLPLRKTVHAGEDFVHLLGGLRRIDETIRYLRLGEGDRLGHAVALGAHPGQWAKCTGRMGIAREERLLDLTWEWTQYAREGVRCPPGRRAIVERDLVRLGKMVFQRRVTPYDLEWFVEDLHSESMLAEIGFPDHCPRLAPGKSKSSGRPPKAEIRHRKILRRYLTDPWLFRRGREIEWVDTAQESESLSELQQGLRSRVARLGLVVEINPTSNLLVANLGGLESHPLWRLNSPFEPDAHNRVAVCIGSDDPLTFSTHLRREYMLIHDTLVANGLSCEEASEWLEQVRKTGLRSRFTIPVNRTRLRGLREIKGPIDESSLILPLGT